jgi:hypothetical protein
LVSAHVFSPKITFLGRKKVIYCTNIKFKNKISLLKYKIHFFDIKLHYFYCKNTWVETKIVPNEKIKGQKIQV